MDILFSLCVFHELIKVFSTLIAQHAILIAIIIRAESKKYCPANFSPCYRKQLKLYFFAASIAFFNCLFHSHTPTNKLEYLFAANSIYSESNNK